MKKRTRDLKGHYRDVKREVREFNIDLSEESWYRMWHTHLDWNGVTSISHKHRKIHILYYLEIFHKINIQTEGCERKFQTWIFLDGHDGSNDAIYFHTDNPEGDFPYWLDNIEWDIEIPPLLIGLLDLSEYRVGMLKGKSKNVYSYIIQRKGLGLDITKKKSLS